MNLGDFEGGLTEVSYESQLVLLGRFVNLGDFPKGLPKLLLLLELVLADFFPLYLCDLLEGLLKILSLSDMEMLRHLKEYSTASSF